ncbi:glycosyltransferase [Teredinibacter turnerae]|uniref:glycosyltransferase n=1 Tax=Teredinibacter turnerae TaxID=2426 RepID=UPI000427AD6E|nr:glycosyltransferase [Teredinibacter turnerae]
MTVNNKFYKPEWISLRILTMPETIKGMRVKGALILNQVDPIVSLYPWIKEHFYIIERHGWFGMNEATQADIMMIEDPSVFELAKREQFNSIVLNFSDGDFVDTDSFCPLYPNEPPQYDVMQIACWSRRKRIEILIQAAAKLPDLRFVQFGHFENSGTDEERRYLSECIKLAERIAPNVTFLFTEHCNYDTLPHNKAEINKLINSTRIGVITTEREGINRFKMECLSSDRPCLVASDSGAATRKHINEKTGLLYKPDPDSLATAINNTLANPNKLSPRQYICETTGITISSNALKNALRQLYLRDNTPFLCNDISYDGRNESLHWGSAAMSIIDDLAGRFSGEDSQAIQSAV